MDCNENFSRREKVWLFNECSSVEEFFLKGNNLTSIVNQTGITLSGINWFSVMFKFVQCYLRMDLFDGNTRFFSFLQKKKKVIDILKNFCCHAKK